VAEEGCESCHRSHAAPHPQRLLAAGTEEAVCLRCHDGRAGAKDLRHESTKLSAHRVDLYTDVHDPAETPNAMAEHVECVDCHDAHRAGERAAGARMPGSLAGASGLRLSGSFLRTASFEYEVCLKCHGVGAAREPSAFRADNATNIRLLIDPRNPSFHPVADTGRNAKIPGLVPPLTPASRTTCTSCHSSDAADAAGGERPSGPHGSNYRPILAAEYRHDAATVPESRRLYALCYRCHDRSTLLQRPGGFPHRLHVVDEGASCAVCHDAHGSRRSPHLINFMLRDRDGAAAVTPSRTGALEYQSLGSGAGRCFLTCHGSDHAPKEYPEKAGASARLRLRQRTNDRARVRPD
jgi:predicted CXXCH cytochrome family protein